MTYQRRSRPRTSRSTGARSFMTRRASTFQAVELQAVGKVGDDPADVGRVDVEEIGDRNGEHLDPQVGIEEQRADLGGRREVLQVVVGDGDARELVLQLGVYRVQLFVDRLQLLLGGLELLGGRPVLLVGGLQFLVGDPRSWISTSCAVWLASSASCAARSSAWRSRISSGPSISAARGSANSGAMPPSRKKMRACALMSWRQV